MRKRNIQLKIWLNKDELEYFDKIATKSGLTRAAYFRQLIYDFVPTDVPTPDYHQMMGELRSIGNNLNQVAQKAHVLGVVDTKPYFAAVEILNKAVVEITNAVMKPRKIERRKEEKRND